METKIKEIEKYLPKDWEEQCRKSKALVRGREIKTAEELLELNLLYLTAGGHMRLLKGKNAEKRIFSGTF